MADETRDSVTTVVMTRNRRDRILRTLERHEGPVIVVDNASNDGTPDAVAAAFPHARLLRLSRNLGALARNLGVQLADTPFVAFADDDSWWEPGAFHAAARVLREHPRLGLIAARTLVGNDGHLDPVCVEMAESPLPSFPHPGARTVVGFVACAAVVRRCAFLEVGGFDAVIGFLGEEESVALDLLAAGWQLAYVPDVVARHHPDSGPASAERTAGMIRNSILTAVMHRPWPVVASRTADALGTTAGRRGVAGTVRRLPRALVSRSRVPDSVEHRCRMIEGAR